MYAYTPGLADDRALELGGEIHSALATVNLHNASAVYVGVH